MTYWYVDEATRVLPWLWLAGETQVDKVLHQVDLWIDFREDSKWNRPIVAPKNVVVIKMPYRDGDVLMASRVIPTATMILEDVKKKGQTALVSCHAGISRSATVALYFMASEYGYEEAWKRLKILRPQVSPDRAFDPIIKQIQRETKKERCV